MSVCFNTEKEWKSNTLQELITKYVKEQEKKWGAVKKSQLKGLVVNTLQKYSLLYPTRSSAMAPASMRGTETKMFVLDRGVQNASFQRYEGCMYVCILMPPNGIKCVMSC